MKRKHLIYAILVLAVVAVIAGWFVVLAPLMQAAPGADSGLRAIQLDGQTIHVSVADTGATRELGLGGHAPLAADEGMLFVFQQDAVNKFWMKDMTFPLDIIWLNADGGIVYIQPGLSPATYPSVYGPDTPTRYVLEVNAGYAAAHGVTVGDTVQL